MRNPPHAMKTKIPRNGRDRNHPALTVPVGPGSMPNARRSLKSPRSSRQSGRSDNGATDGGRHCPCGESSPVQRGLYRFWEGCESPCMRGQSRCKRPVSSVTESFLSRARWGLRGYEVGHWRTLMFRSASAPGGAGPNPPGCRSTICCGRSGNGVFPDKITPVRKQDPQPWTTMKDGAASVCRCSAGRDMAEPWALRASSLSMPARCAIAGWKPLRVTKLGLLFIHIRESGI